MEAKFLLNKELLMYIQDWIPSIYVETFHWHKALEVGLCIKGKGWFYFGDKKYEVKEGDVFVVNNMERHIAQSDASDPSRYLFLYFDPSIVEHGERDLLLPFVYQPAQFQNKIPAHLPVAHKISELFNVIKEEMRQGQIAYQSIVKSALLQICALLLRHYGRNKTHEEMRMVFGLYNKLNPALEYMKEHFREPMDLEDIARLLNLSTSRTRHLFVETLGEGFKEFLLELRINEAKHLLVSADAPITDVCFQSGFQSQAPFYRAFRQITGLTPQEYRQQGSVSALFNTKK